MSITPPDPGAHLAAIVASADDAIVTKDLSGVITSWNPAAERLFGYTVAEAVGSHISLIIPDDRRFEEDYVLSRVREGSGVDHYETYRRRKDGALVDISVTVSPIRDATGTIIGASKIAREITTRKLTERDALRLAAIVQWSDDAIISKDLNGIIQTWNQGAERMFGYSPEEAVGRPITLIIPKDRLHEEVEVLRRIRAETPIDHFETVRRHKDGHLVEISLTVSPIRSANGVILGASKIARDISEQKRLQRAVEEANRSKDEFLAVLSHELRTPLNAVLGYARMLRQQDLPMDSAQRTKALEVLERNADALAKLVNDVLDASKVVTGKLRLSLEPLLLDDLLQESLETIQPAAKAKHVIVQVEIAPRLEIIGDRDRLRQVAWNLLSNAVKFTPSGGTVTLRAVQEGADAVVRVRDTGIGIAANDIARVFQRFWQAEPGVLRERGGLGLGLALVRHFVELHGGSVSAVSAGSGQGAEFTVRLPAQPRMVSSGTRHSEEEC